MVSLSGTAVDFDLMHPTFKLALLDTHKVCRSFPFVSVFTRILYIHKDGSGGKSVWHRCWFCFNAPAFQADSNAGHSQGLLFYLCLLLFFAYTQMEVVVSLPGTAVGFTHISSRLVSWSLPRSVAFPFCFCVYSYSLPTHRRKWW